MKKLSVDQYVAGVRSSDRAVLARAITLVESDHAKDVPLAEAVVAALLPDTGSAIRVGVSGVPGAGKSTFIDALGMLLLARGHRVAVLAVDPSSTITGGSILGDKTRMARLSREPTAFIRPSPSGGTLGGVARKTREAMLLCEAARFDVVLVETVGVGQSETVVAEMVDTSLILMIAGAGDELQGIKRGILEVADVLVLAKADGDNVARAERARRDLGSALHLVRGGSAWEPPVCIASALEGRGLEEAWERVLEHRRFLEERGDLAKRRREQSVRWMWATIEDALLAELRGDAGVRRLLGRIEPEVRDGRVPATSAARQILEEFRRRRAED